MNFLGNLFLHLKNFTTSGLQQMGGMILTNSSEQHVCFMMLLEYDFSCSFVVLNEFYFFVCTIFFPFHAYQCVLFDILNAVNIISVTDSLSLIHAFTFEVYRSLSLSTPACFLA